MRISLLLQREPFGAILEETLASFLEAWIGKPHQVRWYEGRPSVWTMRRQGQQPWLCNIYLNAIFVPKAEPTIFDPIRREFARGVVWWRRPVQRAYVSLATSHRGAGWLAQAGVGISPFLSGAERLLIVAGNHKIRLLDRANGVVYGILKSGFPAEFMQREIETRQRARHLGLPTPPLESVAEDKTWFSERYVSGTPVNRLSDAAQSHRAVREASNALRRLLEQTRKPEPLQDYVDRLQARIQQLVEENHLLTGPRRQSLLSNVSAIIGHISQSCSTLGDHIETALTHGDFQPANILVSGEAVWLIDWEYSAQRQAGYDAFVFTLQSRSPRGLAARLQAFVSDGLDSTGSDLQWPSVNRQGREGRRLHSELFLLEELVLHLEENANPRFVRLGEGLLQLQQEISCWVTIAGEVL